MGFPYRRVPNRNTAAASIPARIQETARTASERAISQVPTVPMEALSSMALLEVKGM